MAPSHRICGSQTHTSAGRREVVSVHKAFQMQVGRYHVSGIVTKYVTC